MRPFKLLSTVLFLALISPICHADDISGGYAMSMPGAIAYLRLVQRGQIVTGYLQSVMIDANAASGARLLRTNVFGDISGRSIELQIDSDRADGSWGNGKVALESPFYGYIMRLSFKRTTVEAWNRMVQAFTTKQVRNAQLRSIKADYDQQTSKHITATDDLFNAKVQLDKALTDQHRGRQILEKAQAELALRVKAFRDAQAAFQAALAHVVSVHNDQPNDQDAANQAQNEANEAQSRVHQAQDDANTAQAQFIFIRDDQFRGLPAADRIVDQARDRVSNDTSVIKSSTAKEEYDLWQERQLVPPKPISHISH